MELVVLDECKNIKSLIKPTSIKAINSELDIELAKDEYNFIVTEENRKVAKEVMAKLSKGSDFIKSFKKQKIDEESKDIDVFSDAIGAMVNKIFDKRQEIADKVAVYENAMKDTHKVLGNEYLKSKYLELDIRGEFQSFDFSLSITAVTPEKGVLTSSAIKALDSIIQINQGKQAVRDLELEKARIAEQKRIDEAVAKAKEEEAERTRIRMENEKEAILKKAEIEKQKALEEQRVSMQQREPVARSVDVPAYVPVPEAVPEAVTPSVPFDVAPATYAGAIAGVGVYANPSVDTASAVTASNTKVVTVLVTLDIPVPDHVPNDAVAKKIYSRLVELGVDETQISSVKAI